MDLNTIWFILIGILFTGYAILDGFDFGVGCLHLFTKDEKERRLLLNSIGPIWDGNEVWLVTGGGALFAAFPNVYATVFSGFYTAFILLLLVLILRAVSIEFRSKEPGKAWQGFWDAAFSASSVAAGLLIGVALGNLAWGIPLNAQGDYVGGLFGLLRPYPLLVGVTTVALFTMHGAIYVVLKTEGDLQAKARTWVRNAMIFFILCYALTTMATLLYVPHMARWIKSEPALFILPVINLLAVANIPRCIYLGREFQAFLSSCATVAALLALFGVGTFPNLVFSNPSPELSLTLYNSASSPKTLSIMLLIALLGVPLVLSYTAGIYWIFRGKVRLTHDSY